MPRRWCRAQLRFDVPGRMLADGSRAARSRRGEAREAIRRASWPPGSRRSPSPSSRLRQPRAGARARAIVARVGARSFPRLAPPTSCRRSASTSAPRRPSPMSTSRPVGALPARPGGAAGAGGIARRAAAADLVRRLATRRPPRASRCACWRAVRPGARWPRRLRRPARVEDSFPLIWGAPPPSSRHRPRRAAAGPRLRGRRRHRFKKGSGLPINLPVIEMIEIGAGGGSIARIDAWVCSRSGPIPRAPIRARPATAGRPASRPSPMPISSSAISIPASSSAARCRSTSRRRGRRSGSAWPSRSGSSSMRPPGVSTRSSTRSWPARRACTASSAAATRARYPLFAFGGAGPVHG